jgi:hypothetical protein
MNFLLLVFILVYVVMCIHLEPSKPAKDVQMVVNNDAQIVVKVTIGTVACVEPSQ